MLSKSKNGFSRRQFVKGSLQAAAVAGFPAIVPASVFGQTAPSKQINVGAIGMGRISRVHDLPNILKVDGARVIAACDLYDDRVAVGKKFVNDFYSAKNGKLYDGVTGYGNYHDFLANKDMEAVGIWSA